MIVSHKYRFIFLKTKKTAGTSIELALTKLCSEDDIVTPLTEVDEAARAGGMGARNWERHGWWQSQRPFLKRRMFRRMAQADNRLKRHRRPDQQKYGRRP